MLHRPFIFSILLLIAITLAAQLIVWNSDYPDYGIATTVIVQQPEFVSPVSTSVPSTSLAQTSTTAYTVTSSYYVTSVITSSTVTSSAISSSTSVSTSVSSTSSIPYTLGPGTYDFSVYYQFYNREYRIYVPSNYNFNNPLPMIIALHGGGGNGHNMAAITCPDGDLSNPQCLHNLGNYNGYIVAYPNGTAGPLALFKHVRTWNGGNCCGNAFNENINDVGFISVMIDEIARDFNLDQNRVYSTGISNGGIMSYRLACELGDKIAAIAPVAGGTGLNESQCNPSRPVAVMQIHGTLDEHYPLNGGSGDKSLTGTNFISINESLRMFAWINGCDMNKLQEDLADVDPNDNTTITREYYTSCTPGKDVEFYRVNYGGHTWPRGFSTLSLSYVGNVSWDISANQEMINFFNVH